MREIEADVDGIPAVLLAPDGPAPGELVLWLTHLGGSAAKERPTLTVLAGAGHPVVTFDPPLHGRRATSADPWAFAGGVLAAFRRRMWPILGQATLEAMRVLSWAQDELGRAGQPARAGGVSMGGDIAIALAGVDERVRRVAGIGSTPNWRRPDMRALADPGVVLDQGEAEPGGQWLADRLDPRGHPEHYRDVAVAFELGGADRHVPAANAEEFRDAVVAAEPAAGDRIHVHRHPGLDHLGVTTSPAAIRAAVTHLVG